MSFISTNRPTQQRILTTSPLAVQQTTNARLTDAVEQRHACGRLTTISTGMMILRRPVIRHPALGRAVYVRMAAILPATITSTATFVATGNVQSATITIHARQTSVISPLMLMSPAETVYVMILSGSDQVMMLTYSVRNVIAFVRIDSATLAVF
jgi:hypothetical protein